MVKAKWGNVTAQSYHSMPSMKTYCKPGALQWASVGQQQSHWPSAPRECQTYLETYCFLETTKQRSRWSQNTTLSWQRRPQDVPYRISLQEPSASPAAFQSTSHPPPTLDLGLRIHHFPLWANTGVWVSPKWLLGFYRNCQKRKFDFVIILKPGRICYSHFATTKGNSAWKQTNKGRIRGKITGSQGHPLSGSTHI